MRPVSLVLILFVLPLAAREFHVSPKGSDGHNGSEASPLKTISAAAKLAQPGDTITVHTGTYRERVTPPRGGDSDDRRITYRAAPGESPVIKGSEVIKNWTMVQPGVWKVAIPLSFFGPYNPYRDLIAGDWFTDKGRPHHTGEVYLNGESFWETHLRERVASLDGPAAWFTESDDKFTYIYANFRDKDPNRETVEINVRDAVFYPSEPGRNYVTVRGFRMMHAATQWAAPTAEQIGLIGAHWSKGWIIENNVISDSKCSCITLGKERKTGHNVWSNDPSKDGAIHYNEVIERALGIGWSRANIGSHVVRNNTIFNCEQAGIAGSLGAVFSQIYGNHIHHVWTKRQFTGAEMGGIKLHAAIDVVIRNNRIHDAGRGLWLDWMAQGTRVTANLFHDNDTDDIFVEVNHGPFVVDNNVLLSPVSLRDWSQGGAYAHNLFAGQIIVRPELKRFTPHHKPHSTELAGKSNIQGGDNRFYNNVFYGQTLAPYENLEYRVFAAGNSFLNSKAKPKLEDTAGTVVLRFERGQPAGTERVTTRLLGKTRVSDLAYENPDGSPLAIDTDYTGKSRNRSRPSPGPFERTGTVTVWGGM